jgi:hypothetical protein
MGQTRTFCALRRTSELPSIADIERTFANGSFVPLADIHDQMGLLSARRALIIHDTGERFGHRLRNLAGRAP